jgi:preprotein translocase subunit SecE
VFEQKRRIGQPAGDVVTQIQGNKVVTDPGDQDDRDEREPQQRAPAPRAPTGGGFFTVYKPHQGSPTRWGTAAGAALIVLYMSLSIYDLLQGQSTYLQSHMTTLYLVTGGFMAVMVLLAFWIMNRPRSADFLIATDNEMKKVNWTSRKELIGSTKVIILFMFSIAIFLFLADIVFGYFFYYIDVLKTRPL